MTYSIDMFEGGDRGQYFSDTAVNVNYKGKRTTGTIRGFISNHSAVVYDIRDNDHLVIPIEDIEWSGLYPPRCVADDGTLYFVGPSGTRSYKKPPTLQNTMALGFNRRGTPFLTGRGTGHNLRMSVFNKYLEPERVYPNTEREIAGIIDYGQLAFAVSDNSGIQIRAEGAYLYRNGMLLGQCPSNGRSIFNLLREHGYA